MFCTKKSKTCSLVKNLYQLYVDFLQKYLSCILLLAIRIWIGLIFFKSGLTKIANIDQTITLFTYEYALPFVSPEFGTYSSIIFELGCGALIIAGLLTRIAVLPLIGMAVVIQTFVFQNQEHFYWLFLLSTLAIYGAGKISADGILAKFCKKYKF